MTDVRAVLHAQHTELLHLRAAVARLRELCSDRGGLLLTPTEVLDTIGDPGREPPYFRLERSSYVGNWRHRWVGPWIEGKEPECAR